MNPMQFGPVFNIIILKKEGSRDHNAQKPENIKGPLNFVGLKFT